MANKKSAKKRVLTNKKKHLQNVSRKSDIKSTTKKMLVALENKDVSVAKDILKSVVAKIARAAGKGILKKNTASRKISKLTRKVVATEKTM